MEGMIAHFYGYTEKPLGGAGKGVVSKVVTKQGSVAPTASIAS